MMSGSTAARWCLLVALCVGGPAVGQTPAKAPCATAEARQFDFWVGRWDVYAKGKLVGHNHISRILGGCTLLEEYDTLPRAYAGKSFNYYDENDGQWHQIWTDNSGVRLHLSGGLVDGSMVMSGPRSTPKGDLIDRITWTDNPDDTVRQVWDVSRDSGATWQTVFDGTYRPAAAEERP